MGSAFQGVGAGIKNPLLLVDAHSKVGGKGPGARLELMNRA